MDQFNFNPIRTKLMGKARLLFYDSPYAAQEFCKHINPNDWSGIDPDDYETCLKGPEESHYLESWDNIESSAYYSDDYGVWTLYQNQEGLWLLDSDVQVNQDFSFSLKENG